MLSHLFIQGEPELANQKQIVSGGAINAHLAASPPEFTWRRMEYQNWAKLICQENEIICGRKQLFSVILSAASMERGKQKLQFPSFSLVLMIGLRRASSPKPPPCLPLALPHDYVVWGLSRMSPWSPGLDALMFNSRNCDRVHTSSAIESILYNL